MNPLRENMGVYGINGLVSANHEDTDNFELTAKNEQTNGQNNYNIWNSLAIS